MSTITRNQITITRNASIRAPRVALAAAAAAVTSIGVAHALHPDLDPSWVPISDLARGTQGWAMTAGFLAWAIAGGATAVALRRVVRGVAGWIGLGLVGISAVGPLLAGVFPADSLTAPNAAGSLSGTLHSVGAMLPDALLPASLLLAVHLGRRGRPLRAGRWWLIGAAAAVWIAAGTVTAGMATYRSQPGATLGPDTPVGWANRAHVLACIGWYAVVSWLVQWRRASAKSMVRSRTS